MSDREFAIGNTQCCYVSRKVENFDGALVEKYCGSNIFDGQILLPKRSTSPGEFGRASPRTARLIYRSGDSRRDQLNSSGHVMSNGDCTNLVGNKISGQFS